MTIRDFAPKEAFTEYWNDFLTFNASDFTITTTEGGSGSATEALGNVAGGVLVVTNDDADNDCDYFQLVGESFKFVSGKRLMGKARFKVSDATDSDVVVGLMITDTSPMETVTHGIYFQKDDGDAKLDFHVVKDSTATDVTDIARLSDDTWVVVEFYYDGQGMIDLYVDDAHVGSAALTNAPDDEELRVTFGVRNGEAAAKVLSVDYLRFVGER